MGVYVYLKPDSVWEFFEKNEARCDKELICIAEDKEAKLQVYLTSRRGLPTYEVYKNEKRLYRESCLNAADARITGEKINTDYLYKDLVDEMKRSAEKKEDKETKQTEDDDPGDSPEQKREDEKYSREDELTFAMRDFLEVVLGTAAAEAELEAYMESSGFGGLIGSGLDTILEYIASEGYAVYRPMTLIDEDTKEKFETNYPYNTAEELDELGLVDIM